MEFDASGELNAETRLWRYMDVGRFLALLKFKSLYFARPHEFSDPWEAHQLQSIRQQSLEYARIMNERLRSRDQQWHHHKTVRDDPETQAKMSAEVWDAVTRLALVNCWHENDSESIAMWKLYTSGAEGVAIESSVGRLKNALQDATFPYRICPVHYVDYAACNSGFSLSTTGLTNPILSALSKRKVFSHEREIRVVVNYLEDFTNRPPLEQDRPAPAIPTQFTGEELGRQVPVNMNALIGRIVVSPDYPSWAVSALQDAVEAAGLRVKVEESAVKTKPPTIFSEIAEAD